MHYAVARRTPHTRISQIKNAEKPKNKKGWLTGPFSEANDPAAPSDRPCSAAWIGHARLRILGIFALRSCIVSASSD